MTPVAPNRDRVLDALRRLHRVDPGVWWSELAVHVEALPSGLTANQVKHHLDRLGHAGLAERHPGHGCYRLRGAIHV